MQPCRSGPPRSPMEVVVITPDRRLRRVGPVGRAVPAGYRCSDGSLEVFADQLALAAVVAVGVGRVVISVPAAPAAGDVSDEGPFGAARDVGPGVAEGTVSVAASDIAVVDVGFAVDPSAHGLHGKTM